MNSRPTCALAGPHVLLVIVGVDELIDTGHLRCCTSCCLPGGGLAGSMLIRKKGCDCEAGLLEQECFCALGSGSLGQHKDGLLGLRHGAAPICHSRDTNVRSAHFQILSFFLSPLL